jgi:hypothetical protein
VTQKIQTNWTMAIVWAISNFGSGFLVKLSGIARLDLLFGQFLVGFVALVLILFFRRNSENAESLADVPTSKSQWAWIILRTVLGISLTYMAYEGYALCFGFAPTVLSLNAVYLPLLGLVVSQLLDGKRKSIVAISSAICIAGVIIGTGNFGAVCDPRGVVFGLVGGVGLAGLALVQKQLAFKPFTASAIYCGLATVLIPVVNQHIGLSLWGIALGLVYAVVQVSSQIANKADPVTSSVIGLSQMPLSTGFAQFALNEQQPLNVWVASVFVAFGIGLLKAKGDRPASEN